MRLCALTSWLLALTSLVRSCDDHDWTSPVLGGYVDHALMRKHDLHKRIQPNAVAATAQPIRQLQWGQINFIHTTDTHGWLYGHTLDGNYSADYGDFAGFVRKMKTKADSLGVDLLLIDSGDLHDGTGLGDATVPNGQLTLPIFKKLPYDLLSVGNHELYTTEIANDTYRNFAPNWGGRYLTSNVDWRENATVVKPFSQRYAYWTTKFGMRIMSFAFLYNFTGNSNQTNVTPVGNVVNQTWFTTQAQRTDIDMFLVAGHITLRDSTEWNLIYAAIRQYHPTTPITFFGGHRHIRDAVIWDNNAVGIASGRYCETAGWMSISGFPANITSANTPSSNLTRIARSPINLTGVTPNLNSNLAYSRQYLDFNRFVFEFHTNTTDSTFNSSYGSNITNLITTSTNSIANLTQKLGCVSDNYFMSRYPMTSPNSIYNYLAVQVLPKIVVAPSRQNMPRMILLNTGSVRFDMLKGPFSLDNAYQTLPFNNTWIYMTVPYSSARYLLANMQTDKTYRKRDTIAYASAPEVPGYVTLDDFGSQGDNTIHLDQGSFDTPHYIQANVSVDGIDDTTLVDVYATTYSGSAAARYLVGNTTDWMTVDGGFSTFDTLPRMARGFWSQDC